MTLIEVLVSVAILAMGTVLVMQALARVAHAQVVAESQANAYLFAVSKMADVELAVHGGGELKDHDQGSFRIGTQRFEWVLATSPIPEDPELKAVALTVAWRQGQNTFERRLETWLKPIPEAP